jgi:hypothetical protein
MAMRRWLLLSAIVGCLALVHGCTSQSSGDPMSLGDDIPLHHHVVCLAGPEGKTVTCKPPERLASFNAWAAEAMTRPMSTFTIWAAGPTREGYRRVFVACVPSTWGGNVWNAKRAFLEASRQGAMGSQMGVRVPERCVPPEPRTPGFHRLEVAATVLPVGREVIDNMVSQPSATPLHAAVLCDRSSSTLGVACTPSGLLHAFDRWLAESVAAPGSSLSMYEVGPSHDAVKPLYQLVIPERSVGENVAALSGARAEVTHLLAHPATGSPSAVVEGIYEVVSMLRERHGRYRLMVLSDLFQYTPGVMNFERTVPPSARFVAWLRKEGLVADLRDIPVTVCGVHNRPLPKGQGSPTRTRAVQVRALWEDAFRAMGAGEVTMRTRCDDPFATLTTKEDQS